MMTESHQDWVDRIKRQYPKVLGPPHPWTYLEFAIDTGWRGIVEKLAAKLEALPYSPKAVQIKEKFGGLRFYINAGNDEIFAMITEAQNESYVTCQACSAEAKLRNHKGWMTTLCNKCWKKEKK